MFDHVGFAVKDFAVARAFYVAALRPLGLVVMNEGDGWAAFGAEGHTEFWIGTYGPPPGPIHFAFVAQDQASVRAFYDAAIAAGGKDNGPPGLRPQYSGTYYAAFVFDADGHNVEAVCRKAEG